jgi:putative transposase
LEGFGMKASMSRKGNCWDNAVAESFFATLKTELIHRRPWPTRAVARKAIDRYISEFYNSRRRHSFVDGASPIEFEKAMRDSQALAA